MRFEMIDTIKNYLNEVLALKPRVKAWAKSQSLPIYLRELYTFQSIVLYDQSCLLLCDESDSAPSSKALTKHIQQVQKKFEGAVIYVREQVSAYQRKRLIEEGIAFIIPNNQMYLPPLGLDLREQFKSAKKKVETLSPVAQVCILDLLLSEEQLGSSASRSCAKLLSERLGYSIMSISRALKEFSSVDLAETYESCFKDWLNGEVTADRKRELWEQSQVYLRNPIRKKHWILTDHSFALKAGESALAEYSNLATGKTQSFAMSSADYKALKEAGEVQEIDFKDDGVVEIEVWAYDPKLLADASKVDPLSLYLSLKDDDDERVQLSLDEMMEGISCL